MENLGKASENRPLWKISKTIYRIIVAVDLEVERIGLRTILSRYAEIYKVVGEASNCNDLMNLLDRYECDILVTDFLIPEVNASLDGIILLRELRNRHTELQIITLISFRDAEIVRILHSEGVRAVVEKTSAEKILDALRVVKAGHIYISERVQGKPTSHTPSRGR